MIYGYARVSSKGQEQYGVGLEVQEKQLVEAGAQKVFHESYTGTKKHRPELDKLLESLTAGDTLIVTKLDRIARSAFDGLGIIREIVGKGAEIIVLNMGKFDNTPTGKLMQTVLLGFAEFERDLIVSRMDEGKALKRATDPEWREGRKRADIPDFEKYRQKQKDGELTVTECCQALGISRSLWYNRCREATA